MISSAEDGVISVPRRRVLVAEDDDDMRRLVADVLRRRGYDVEEASDGAGILDRIEASVSRPESIFDLIVSDVAMPHLSGLDVLAALRCAHWETPVILMSARADADMRDEARDLGAAFLDKPFDMKALESLVGQSLVEPRGRRVLPPPDPPRPEP